MKKQFYISIVVAFILSCHNQTANDNHLDTKTEKIGLIQTQRRDSIKKVTADSTVKITNLQMEENRKRLGLLKNQFVFKKDEFKNIGWYVHKSQIVGNSYNRKCLRVHINTNGYIYLEDQYYAEDWIFHTGIEVKIGNNIYRSETVEISNNNNRTQNGSGSVWENIDYLDGQDNGIIKAIAQSQEKVIKVRFNGKQYNSDFNLSSRDIQSIKEGYELADLIKKVKN